MAAAAAIVALVSGSAVWLGLRPATPLSEGPRSPAVEVAATAASLVEDTAWDAAVLDLEQVL
jgi:hypothetical protein